MPYAETEEEIFSPFSQCNMGLICQKSLQTHHFGQNYFCMDGIKRNQCWVRARRKLGLENNFYHSYFLSISPHDLCPSIPWSLSIGQLLILRPFSSWMYNHQRLLGQTSPNFTTRGRLRLWSCKRLAGRTLACLVFSQLSPNPLESAPSRATGTNQRGTRMGYLREGQLLLAYGQSRGRSISRRKLCGYGQTRATMPLLIPHES